jgi:predicted nucleic acid-binding protein
MKIVFNSSPLIFLSSWGFLDLFLTTSSQFLLPESVKQEISTKQDQSSQYINRLIGENTWLLQKVQLVSLANRLNERLGIGESEAITLGVELQPDYIILDDFAARKEAIRLGLNVKGTLAVIRKLQLDGKINISDLDILYQQIREVNFRVKWEIFASIFEDW